jgi:hypothetical protein
VSVDSFSKAGQLQRRALFWLKHELLVKQQNALGYFSLDLCEENLLEEVANSVK